MPKSVEQGRWQIQSSFVQAERRQKRTYRAVWVGFVGLSLALFGVLQQQRRTKLLPWQGVIFAWPLSVTVLHLLVTRAEELPSAVLSRLLLTQGDYAKQSRHRTVLSHNGLSTVFRSLVLTNILTLAIPFLTRRTEQLVATLPRFLNIAAWASCVVSVVVSATALGLVQSQAPIDFTFFKPSADASDAVDVEEQEHLSVDAAQLPVTLLLPLLEAGQWMIIATTSRRHNVWLRLSESTEKSFDLTTTLATDHPLYSPKSKDALKPQLSAVQ